MMSILIRKVKTAFRMRFMDVVALLTSRLMGLLWCGYVIMKQTTFRVPRDRRRLIVYLTPGDILVNGGVMSIYNQATSSRMILVDAAVVLTTFPRSKKIYAVNRAFPNNERIWRWGQVMRLVRRFDDVLIHIPDYYAGRFFDDLRREEVGLLRACNFFSINIMDQNIIMMPKVEELAGLRKLTKRITQTCAHTKYSGQEFAEKFMMPTIWIPAHWCMDCYPEFQFEQKERRIVYSPDDHPRKIEILDLLRQEFSDFEFYEIRDITFPKFMNVVARSFFTITFGEGLDGYYSSPLRKHSMSFSVYNEEFFSKDIDWCAVWNVFHDYDDMKKHLVEKMKECLSSKIVYERRVNEVRDAVRYVKAMDAERGEVFMDRLCRFYAGNFDYYPRSNNA